MNYVRYYTIYNNNFIKKNFKNFTIIKFLEFDIILYNIVTKNSKDSLKGAKNCKTTSSLEEYVWIFQNKQKKVYFKNKKSIFLKHA